MRDTTSADAVLSSPVAGDFRVDVRGVGGQPVVPVSGSSSPSLSRRALAVLGAADRLRSPHRHLGSGELLAALADDIWGPAGLALAAAGVEVEAVVAGVAALEVHGPRTGADMRYSPVLRRIQRSAIGYAPVGSPVTTEHLLRGLLDEPDSVAATVLEVLRVRPQTIRAHLDNVDPEVARTDGELGRLPTMRWCEVVELDHPPSVVWALVDPPEHAPVLEENVLWGVRRQTATGQEVHEFLRRPGGPGDSVLVAVDRADVGLSVRLRQIKPVPKIPGETEAELVVAVRGSVLRMTQVVEIDALGPTARLVGRRGLGHVEAGVRAEARAYLDRVRSCLDGGWLPPDHGLDDGPR